MHGLHKALRTLYDIAPSVAILGAGTLIKYYTNYQDSNTSEKDASNMAFFSCAFFGIVQQIFTQYIADKAEDRDDPCFEDKVHRALLRSVTTGGVTGLIFAKEITESTALVFPAMGVHLLGQGTIKTLMAIAEGGCDRPREFLRNLREQFAPQQLPPAAVVNPLVGNPPPAGGVAI
jgi:hypothetical protein